MAERPILLFSEAVTAERGNKHGGAEKIQRPSHSSQVGRLAPKLAILQQAVLSMQSSPVGIESEKTLVFEVGGDVESFYTAVKNLGDQVEWIFDMPEVFNSSDDFYVYKEDKATKDRTRRDDKPTFGGKIYCVLTNAQALQEILGLWDKYGKDPNTQFPLGKAGLRNVFDNLIDIHPWGYQERLEETGVLDIWKEELEDDQASNIKCEFELFYRKANDNRMRQARIVENDIQSLGGSVIASSVIHEINYHAILASVPRQVVENIVAGNRTISIVVSDPIMFIRPVGQSAFIQKDNSFDSDFSVPPLPEIIEEPIVALFDGVPQENHPYLADRLIIDDPDDYTAQYTVQARKHGTSMASLIAYGDLGNIVHQSMRKIYVRPIMKPYPTINDDTVEAIPDDILLVDKIHEAVRRLFETTAGAAAPTVKVINLSIGLSYRQFDRAMSPLARLLDWLSYKYRVLFVVSAGNHAGNDRGDDIENLDLGMDLSDFAALSMDERDSKIIDHLNNNSRHLRLLAPAESVNALTVGATFDDATSFTENERWVLPCSNGMISPISSLGKGMNNAVKPDIVYDGGRKFVMASTRAPTSTKVRWANAPTREPGIISAAPTDIAAGSSKIMYTFGTSDAAALISHEAGRCYDALQEVFGTAKRDIPDNHIALLLKAMLIHGAEWGELGEKISNILQWKKREPSDKLHRFIGFGKPDIEKAIECAKNRVTLMGYGDLKNGEAQLFTLPLPFDFSSNKLSRRLTATLTYFSPIVSSRQKYRAADVWFTIENSKKNLLDARINASDKAVTRGSVQHEIFENEQTVVWDEDGEIRLRVNCRADAAENFSGEIPFALMVSFEIKSDIDIDVYTKVAEKVKPRIIV